MKQPQHLFCMKQFKPAIILIVVLAVVVIGWTVYRESKTGPRGVPSLLGNGAVMQAATAPPIRSGQGAPHPDWGSCTTCHDVIPAKGGGEAVRGAAAAMTAAFVAPPLGIWLRPLTPATADRLGLDNTDGVLVSGISNPSPALKGGLKVGDVIVRIDEKKVESVNEALAVIAEKSPQDTLKIQILREGRRRKLFVTISKSPGARGPPSGRLVAAPVPAAGRIAMAVTGMVPEARVAPAFGRSPAFLVYDPAGQRFFYLENLGQGSLTAGQRAASQLANARVTALLVGTIGPGSMQRLRASGIQVYTGVVGPVQRVLDKYLEGRLVPASGTVIPGALRGAAPVNSAAGGSIAVAAQGPTLDARVSESLGLAPYLIIYDLGKERFEAIAKQPGPDQGTSAVQTAHLIVDRGALAVIAGGISPASVQTLSTLGVFSFAGVSGLVGQAIEMYRRGGLQATTVTTPVPGIRPAGRGVGGGMTL